MATWITMTEADLRNSKASALIDAYASAALGTGQSDPVPDAIASVCQTIRTKVQSCRQNRISLTANAIPPSLKRMALRLICWEMQSRININESLPPTKQDGDDHRNDLQELERIAECKVVIELPNDPQPIADVQRAGSIQMGTAAANSTRVTTRDRLNRL